MLEYIEDVTANQYKIFNAYMSFKFWAWMVADNRISISTASNNIKNHAYGKKFTWEVRTHYC